jgi:hypothetical protein
MKKLILLSLSLLLLAACTSRYLSETEKSSIIESYITTENLEKQTSITAFSLDSWSSLSDQYIILRSSPFKPYLIKLASRCHDLEFSPTLIVNSRMSGSLSTGFDSVYTPENAVFKCYISRIYKLSKEQNKALISAINPVAEDKKIEPAPSDEVENKVKTLTATET